MSELKYKRPTDQNVIDASDNVFIEGLYGNHIKYTKDFYVVMYKRLERGMTPLEAYESLGFPVKTLGKERAYATAQRARKLGEAGGYTVDSSNYDGSVPRNKMGSLSKDEELAYMRSRTLYLESLLELQKKIPSILEAAHIYSKKAK